MKLTEIFCFICSVGGGYSNLIGAKKSFNDTEADIYLLEIRHFCLAWKRAEFPIKVKDRNQTFGLRPELCLGIIMPILECGFKRIGIRNAEYAKYSVGHFRRMLL